MKLARLIFISFLIVFIPESNVIGLEMPGNDFAGQDLINFTVCGSISPKPSTDIKTSCWGIQMGSLKSNVVLKASEIGVKWTRFTAAWPDIEKQKGVYDFSETDHAFALALENGITPFVNLGKGNNLYTGYSGYEDAKMAEIYGKYSPPPTVSEEAMNAYLSYVKATVERYKDKIKYWEIWNEPNHQNYWGAPPDGNEYGKLLKRTAEVIRSIDPECWIIAGATAGIDPEFTSDFLEQGTGNLIDIITFHNYGPVPEERIYAAIELRKIIDSFNPDILIWQGECGYPSASSTRDYRGRAPWGENIQAKWLLRQSFTDTYFCQAQVSTYFMLANFGNRDSIKPRTNLNNIDRVLGFPERNGSRVRTWGVNEKCLLSNPDLKPKPGFYAYQNLCSIWEESYQPDSVSYKFDITHEGVFSGIAYDDAFPSVPLLAAYKSSKDQYLIAWWLPWYMSEFLPELAQIDLKVSGIKFTDPVMIDLLNGKVYEIPHIERYDEQIHLPSLPLADYPLVICERSIIKMI